MQPAILQTCFSRSWGGLEMVALEMATRMSASGMHVTTACAPGSPLSEHLLSAALPVIPVVRYNKYFSPGTIRILRRELLRRKYSAVLVEQMNELWQVVPAVRGMRDIKLVGISHTLVGVRKKDWLHGRLYGRVDRLIALTDIHRRNLVENLPVREQNISVLPNAVDLRRFHPGLRSEALRQEFLRAPDELLLGVVSRVDKGKGLLEAVEAVGLLKARGLRFRMLIVGRETIGEEGMAKILSDEIARLGLSQHVFVVGHRPDIGAVMASLDLLVMPSPSETFGRVLIEAMASRTAIVASSGGGVPDIIRDGVDGLLVNLSPESLAGAMERCMLDAGLRERLTAEGLRAALERYDQRVLDRRLYEIIGV